MAPREHHYLFSQHLFHQHVFESPDKVFEELNAPMRDAFLMFLWDSVGEVVDVALKPVDVGTIGGVGEQGVHKLEVMGVDRRGGFELAMVSMPPTQVAGETIYIAIARRGDDVHYFLFEHSAEPGHPTVARKNADGTRINLGRRDSTSPETFLNAVGAELGFGTEGADVGYREPAPQQPPKKKGGGVFMKGCLGCGALMALGGLAFFVGIGALAYLEEGRPLHNPDDEIASVDVTVGEPFTIQFDGSGTGYSFFDFWLEVPGGGPVSVDVILTCSEYDSPEKRAVSDADYGTKFRSGSVLLRVHDEYMRHRPGQVTCAGQVDPMLGELDGARLIVSRTQRPSDFVAF